MVGYDKNRSKLTYKDVAFAGATSGFITRAFCQPLDVLKIRFQLQVEPISTINSIAKYRSIQQAIFTISKEEGMKSFWKGHIPAQYLSIIYGFGQFWCFEIASKFSHDLGISTRYQKGSNFVCGMAAGTFATVISFPFDVVRTRLVAQSETNRVYTGICHTFFSMCKNEGYLVLFRGLFPTIIQVAPHAGVQFMSYKFFEAICHILIPESLEGRTQVLTTSVICGSLAGLCGKTAIYPLDLAKKRMQIQGLDRTSFGKNFTCNGLIDCLYKTYTFEGVLGLYKGLYPSLIKAVVTTALHFSTYEFICLELSRYRDIE